MLQFDLADLPSEAETVRGEIRGFLERHIAAVPPERRALSWSAHDPDFSRALGAAGFIGMTWPEEHGGQGRSAFARYVVLEELLAAGAPVGAHWIADRQSGPLLMRYGNARQKALLPAMARGECFFCIGMSEPDSGSDLAAVRTRAARTADGWRVNGTKLWSSGAHLAHYMIALLRTSAESKHGGLSQFLVDLKGPGITIRPIRDLTGAEHFNEVVFEDAILPDDALIGAEGEGWAQVTAELALERSGPERYLSSYCLVAEIAKAARGRPELHAVLGEITAEMLTLRRMSLSVAGQLERGENPAIEAAMVKDLGALFEQKIPRLAHTLLALEPASGADDPAARIAAALIQTSPSFSLRGGTREILRGIIARGLGLR